MLLFSPAETQELAVRLAEALQPGDCVALSGDLGAGKTTFVQALIGHLSDGPVGVTSPTFTLLQTYDVRLHGGVPAVIWHFDLYRLEDAAELAELGLDEALESGIAVIEWPEIVLHQLPAHTIRVTLDFGQGETNREVTIHATGAPLQRLRKAGLV